MRGDRGASDGAMRGGEVIWGRARGRGGGGCGAGTTPDRDEDRVSALLLVHVGEAHWVGRWGSGNEEGMDQVPLYMWWLQLITRDL